MDQPKDLFAEAQPQLDQVAREFQFKVQPVIKKVAERKYWKDILEKEAQD